MQFSMTGTGTVSVLFPHPQYTASQEIPFRNIPSPHAQEELGSHTHAHTLIYAWWYGLCMFGVLWRLPCWRPGSEVKHEEGHEGIDLMSDLTSDLIRDLISGHNVFFFKFIIQRNHWEVGDYSTRSSLGKQPMGPSSFSLCFLAP